MAFVQGVMFVTLTRKILRFGGWKMLREFLMTVHALSQAGADLNKFYDTVDKIITFEHDEAVAALDNVYDQTKASTKKLADAQS